MAKPKLPMIKKLSIMPASGKEEGTGVLVGVAVGVVPPPRPPEEDEEEDDEEEEDEEEDDEEEPEEELEDEDPPEEEDDDEEELEDELLEDEDEEEEDEDEDELLEDEEDEPSIPSSMNIVMGFMRVIMLVEPSPIPAILVVGSKLTVTDPVLRVVAFITARVPVPETGLVGEARMVIWAVPVVASIDFEMVLPFWKKFPATIELTVISVGSNLINTSAAEAVLVPVSTEMFKVMMSPTSGELELEVNERLVAGAAFFLTS